MRIASFSMIHNHLICNDESNNSALYAAASALAIIRFAMYIGKIRKTQSLNHAFKTSPTVLLLVSTIFAC